MHITSIVCMGLVCTLCIYPILASLLDSITIGVDKFCPECKRTKLRRPRTALLKTLVSLQDRQMKKCKEFPWNHGDCDGELGAEHCKCSKCGSFVWVPRQVCPNHHTMPPPLIYKPPSPGEQGSTSNT
ncbi:hypothetical protein PGT21_024448 [Puccinia graminis f. sp. tritici]|uniref:Uncharacterized protein n=1 Tax=Puccinia graminis f. sp. tritici TaxID=56615 RepID=A0A5B0PFW2_PUCGR|nr:hypothetical protein PGT21_024448 [Puccinia graminis f. sp. tritici]KAA1112272.1 hypothetical protein PGTUg99_017147 [Puccinia graminis f. sp. tritici]KAA1123476.1 hypothetical protein PGTUg99_018138 [Puccinia graminis f. sp. tritici]